VLVLAVLVLVVVAMLTLMMVMVLAVMVLAVMVLAVMVMMAVMMLIITMKMEALRMMMMFMAVLMMVMLVVHFPPVRHLVAVGHVRHLAVLLRAEHQHRPVHVLAETFHTRYGLNPGHLPRSLRVHPSVRRRKSWSRSRADWCRGRLRRGAGCAARAPFLRLCSLPATSAPRAFLMRAVRVPVHPARDAEVRSPRFTFLEEKKAPMMK